MADRNKRTGGSHAKPTGEKKRIGFRFPRKTEPGENILPAEDELYEQPYLPQEEAVSPETQESAAQSDYPEYDESDEAMTEPTRSELRRAERDAKREAREAEKEARRAAKNEDTPEKRDRRRKGRIALIVAVVVVLLVLAGATYAGYSITNSDMTLPKVFIGEVFVGSMTEEQIRAALKESDWDKTAASTLTLKLPAGVSGKLKRSVSGAIPTTDDAVASALKFGHDGSWYENLFRYLRNFVVSEDLVAYYRVMDDAYISTEVNKLAEEFYTATAEGGYVIENEKSMMYMIKGGGAMKFDTAVLCTLVRNALISGESELEYSQFVSEPAMPDFNAIHRELGREPVDASYTEKFEVVPEVVGCKFDVSAAELIWKAAKFGDSLEIPIEIIFPTVTSEELENRLYRDILGEQTTYYTYSSDNRINNLNLAVSKINGVILLPGETFSYNDTVGQRTEEAGFLAAGAYDDGEVVQQIGGGVCQISSTLYSATLYAQMETVDRTCHFFAVDYLDKGMDATVSWPKPNFKFKNCRDYPIKINAVCDNTERAVTIRILGTDVDGTYVKIRRDTYTKFGEYGEAIGYSIFQYRDIYAADGTYLRTVTYDYLDDYYFHDYKTITEQAKAAAEAAAAGGEAETGDPGTGEGYSGSY